MNNIYIENDLTWEERKVQEKISSWVKLERSKGKEIKIGLGKVRIDGTLWTDIEKGLGITDRGMVEEREERRNDGDKNFV